MRKTLKEENKKEKKMEETKVLSIGQKVSDSEINVYFYR